MKQGRARRLFESRPLAVMRARAWPSTVLTRDDDHVPPSWRCEGHPRATPQRRPHHRTGRVGDCGADAAHDIHRYARLPRIGHHMLDRERSVLARQPLDVNHLATSRWNYGSVRCGRAQICASRLFSASPDKLAGT